MLLDLTTTFASFVTSTQFVLAFLAIVTYWYYTSLRNLPPGPWGIPILGYLPFLDTSKPAEELLHELNKKYGRIMSIKLGSYLTVIIDDIESIKEAYVKQADIFSGRPSGILMKAQQDDKGVLVTDGEGWKENRRFSISTLRDFGMGKFSLEPRIVEEIHFFLEELAKLKGQPTDYTLALGMSAANVISTLEFGKRFDFTDKKLPHLFHLIDEIVAEYESIHARHLFSWLPYIPFSDRITGQIRTVNYQKQIRIYLREIIEQHKLNHDENSKHDYIDAFLQERNAVIKKTGDEGFFSSEDLEANLQNLFLAATETTVSTLRWSFLLLMSYPNIQKKLHEELDHVLGMDRAPSVTDKPLMKYTEAFLCEVHRFASVIPLNVLHTNLEETHLCGYRIPKRTNIATNLWAVNFNPKLWKNPEQFTPERFINEEGKIETPAHFIPFGIGKRSCLGESLARMKLFLYLTSILQRFTVLPPEGTTPKLDIESKIVRRPKPYKARFVEREGYQVTY